MTIANTRWPAWTEQAVCAETDPNAYFPEKGAANNTAKRICKTKCLVREQCLDWALTYERQHPASIHGIYGGLSAHERKILLRDAS